MKRGLEADNFADIQNKEFLDLRAYPLHKHLLSVYYVAGIMLDSENIKMMKTCPFASKVHTSSQRGRRIR